MGLIIDNFAGGGGASTGIEAALGRPVDIAINHNHEAIAMHRINHPQTRHYIEDVWDVDPYEVTGGEHVDLLWLSPDCKHFSRAKGGKPVEKKIRGLSWIALKYAGTVRPDVIMLENVPEIMTWGPLAAVRDPKSGRVIKSVIDQDGKTHMAVAASGEVVPYRRQQLVPDKKRAGETFKRFVGILRRMGYVVDWRVLKACDYGAPTIRSRLFLIARCDGLPIVWPDVTHGPGRPKPYRTAAECIDWSIPCPSIFERKRPLAEATNRRIAKGIMRFVVRTPNPFIVSGFITEHANASSQRNFDIEEPLRTQCAQVKGGHFALVSPHITKFRANSVGHPVDEPLHTITACSVGEANHPGGAAPLGVVSANLITYYGDNGSRDGDFRGGSIESPIATQTTENRHALVVTTLVKQNFGEKPCQNVDEPLHTITTQGNKFQLCEAFLLKNYTGVVGSKLDDPVGSVTSVDHHSLVMARTIAGEMHFEEVRAFLVKYYGNEKEGVNLSEPMHTITAKDHLGLVAVAGAEYAIADIGMRMLQPRELYRAQGFPESYIIDFEYNGKTLSKSAQVRMVGNSVPPPCAEALVRANVPSARAVMAA